MIFLNDFYFTKQEIPSDDQLPVSNQALCDNGS